MPLLRKRILSLFLSKSPPPASPCAVHRLLSITTTTSTSTSASFVIEDYLVATCGLSSPQAYKASLRLSHLKSPSRPDAVITFLAGLGLSHSGVAAAVAADPLLLCADVPRTLDRRVAELGYLGLSRPQIARLLPLGFRRRCLGRNVHFWLQFFGTWNELLPAVKTNAKLLSCSIEKVAMPNLAVLQQCGADACDIARLSLYSCRLLTMNHKDLQRAVARAEKLDADGGSAMFRRIIDRVAITSAEKVAEKIHQLEKLGWSQENTNVILSKVPTILGLPVEKIRLTVEFLMRDVGLDAPYIAQRPALLMYSLERRLLPRHCLIKVLKAKGLVNAHLDYCYAASLAERKFVHKFVDPYKDLVPGIADDYASRCSRKSPIGVAL